MATILEQFSSQKRQWVARASDACGCIESGRLEGQTLEHLFENLVHILGGGQDREHAQMMLDTVRVLHLNGGGASRPDGLHQTLQALQLMHCTSRVCATTSLPAQAAAELSSQIDQLLFASVDLCISEILSISPGFGSRANSETTHPHTLTVVAHELRTPLTLISAYADMMAYSADHLDQEMKEMLQGIIRGANRLESLISDMLDTAIIYESDRYLDIVPIKLNGLLLQTCSEMTSAIEMRGQTLTVKSFPSGSVSILGDPTRLRQAIWNVLSNAVKYTPDGGEILVESTVRDGFVEIRIQDQGIGIPDEQQDKIFGEYQTLTDPRLHSSGKVKFNGGGLGLGLSLARGIIEAHGGTIWVKSPIRPKDAFPGTSFHLILPTTKRPLSNH